MPKPSTWSLLADTWMVPNSSPYQWICMVFTLLNSSLITLSVQTVGTGNSYNCFLVAFFVSWEQPLVCFQGLVFCPGSPLGPMCPLVSTLPGARQLWHFRGAGLYLTHKCILQMEQQCGSQQHRQILDNLELNLGDVVKPPGSLLRVTDPSSLKACLWCDNVACSWGIAAPPAPLQHS